MLAIGGTRALVALAAALANWRTVLICLVYGLSLVVLYTMSTLYHAFPFEGVKRLFRVFDHSSIYLLIAGSYTPFTLILLDGTWKGPGHLRRSVGRRRPSGRHAQCRQCGAV